MPASDSATPPSRPIGEHDRALDPGAPQISTLANGHVRQAILGDLDSLEWIATRLSPILEVRARDQLGKGLRGVCEPEDIVNTVWERALPKLSSLQVADGHGLRSLLAFLLKIQSHLCIDLLRRRLRVERAFPTGAAAAGSSVDADPVRRLAADQTSIFSRVARDDSYASVVRTLSNLDRADRDLVFLRTVRGASNTEAARLLRLNLGQAAQRYHRALETVRRRLPPSVLEALAG